MKTRSLFLLIVLNVAVSIRAISQTSTTLQIDLADKKAASQEIDLGVSDAVLINKSNDFTYKVTWKRRTVSGPVLTIPAKLTGGSESADDKLKKCSAEVQNALTAFETDDESKIKVAVQTVNQLIKTLGDDDCRKALVERVNQTRETITFPYRGILAYNQVITLEITKIGKDDKQSDKWSYTFTTEEKSRWLIHYGLTYTPNFLNKVDHFFSFADTGVANKYTITKENKNGPKPWENISATMNFTYPFHVDPRPFDGGFTAGFGLNPGFELSGHAGLSAIIGENVILGTGIAFMQKYKLKGQYKENQIIKTNLDFDALHEKVWLPELYFTIGFRFNGNPFKSSKSEGQSSTGNSSSTGSGSSGSGNTGSGTPAPVKDTIKTTTDTTASDTPKRVGFQSIRMDSKTIGNPDYEYSALTVWNDKLLFVPQYGNTIKVISKSTLIKDGKVKANLTDQAFTELTFNDPNHWLDTIKDKSYDGIEAATVHGDTIFLAVETKDFNDYCFIVNGIIRDGRIELLKKKKLLSWEIVKEEKFVMQDTRALCI